MKATLERAHDIEREMCQYRRIRVELEEKKLGMDLIRTHYVHI